MSHAALGEQFEPYAGGPAEAERRDRAAQGQAEPWRYEEQQHLFAPESVKPMEAHQQSPAQFAADPRTWWHGRFTGPRGKVPGGGGEEGFHAGTMGAARKRLSANERRRSEKPGVRGRLFPLRITGPVTPPEMTREEPAEGKTFYGKPASIKHRELGEHGAEHGYLYHNVVEGGISVGVPQRKGFMSTHKEMVEQAQTQGKKVHPLVAWAVKKGPEHTGEVYPQHRYRLTEETPAGQRYAQEHMTFPSKNVFGPNVERGGVGRETRSYETEGGKTMHVRRIQGGVLGGQWEPDWGKM